MTITSEINRVGPLPGNGSAAVFSFSPMQVLSLDDLLVVKVGSDGTETPLVRGSGPTNYSVSVSSFPGTGSITYPASGEIRLGADEKLVIARDLDFTQLTVLENQGGYFPKVQEGVFDRLTILLQQLKEAVDRSLKISIGQSDGDADEFVQGLLEAASEAEASAEAAAASAEAAALFDPSNYVAKAGDTMTGALVIDPVGDVTNPRISLQKNSNERADIYRSVPLGNQLIINQLAPSASPAIIEINAIPLDGTSAANIDLFRNAATTGDRRLRFYHDTGAGDVASSMGVRVDGLDISGAVHFVSSTYENPLRIGNVRLWNDTTTNEIRWRKNTDPVSATNGALMTVFEQRFTSGLLTISSAAGTLSASHSFSTTPSVVRPVLVCDTGEHGYSAGDEVEPKGWQGGPNGGVSPWASATDVGVSYQNLRVAHKSTGVTSAVTIGNWRFKIYAWV